MEAGSSSSVLPNAKSGTRSVPLEIDLNETPVLSPREAVDGEAVFVEEEGCRSCGKRKCVECESVSENKRLRSAGVGVLDMNASPPQEHDADKEGFVSGGESSSQNVDRSAGKRPIVHSRTFIGQGQSCTPPVTYANLLHLENRFNFHTASLSGLDILLQHRPTFESNSREADLYSTLQGKLLTPHYTPPVYVPHRASDVYLQALREYISQRGGVLGDGWHVIFDYCQIRRRTFVVYCGPDGSRFESMAEVARYLGLEAADRVNGYGLAHIGSYPNQRGTETSRSIMVNNYKVCENSSKGKNFHVNYPNNEAQIPPAFEMGIHARTHSRGTVKIDGVESGEFGSQHFNDGFPLQFEEFFILSVGKIDKRPSYHNSSQICPVGYRSSWHDKITGSLFICEISDGGDMGPVFKVRRCPCTTQSIPDAATILSRPTVCSSAGEKEEKVDSALDDDKTCIQMILDENAPPNLDDDILLCSRKSAIESSNFRRAKSDFQQIGRGDLIGEFEIEGRSPSLVWEMVTKTILHACHEAYQQKGLLQFICKHDTEGRAIAAIDTIDSLSKFCYQAGPTNIPHLIQSISDFDACLKIVAKWLHQDRFGLDVEFVQELIEQLPGVASCSEYKFLNQRGHGSNLQTVASGFLVSKRKGDVQGGKESNYFMRSCRNPRKNHFPLGKTLSPNLPAYLTGDALQVWEFTRRFSDVLGLEKHISFQELESEFINPWLEKRYPVPHTISKCTGEILRNAHSSLLKVLVSELSFKVALHVYPNHDEDGMPIRGKRKETDNSVFAKKIKLETLPINVLTWPELARRYALAVVSMEDNFESSEIAFRESARVFHCLQGDGGTLSGSLTGVPAMEADALFLAEASKRVFSSLKPKDDLYSIDIRDSESNGASENSKVNESDIPEWAEALEPVKKLPTNVGARIRNCVYEALRKNPPEWAREKLEHSISREVYKGNASGPTKRAVVEVLGRVRKESPQVKPEKREHTKRASTLSDVVVKQCRIVLRKAAAADKKRVFCHRLGKTFLSPNESDDEGLIGFLGMVSRPLDLRTIDIRLAAGTYGVSLEAFLEDAREVWRNICTAFRDDSNKLDLAEILSVRFEELYETEVLSLVNKIVESGYPNCPSEEAKKEIDDMLACVSDVMLPKAPWDDGVCRICGMDRDDQSCLLCDVCDAEYHTYCLNPPLPRIPEGNWYCPSCVAAKVNYRNSRGAQMVNLRKKVIPRREFTDSFLERLTKLAQSMELKDYWELTLEERIVLLKFLCDEALNTTIIRDHLDHCDTLSLDLQQKLRLLNSELKNLVYREEVMAANMAKGRINMANEGETGVSVDATKVVDPMLNNDASNGDDPVRLDSKAVDPSSTCKLDLNTPSEYANVSQSHKHETSSFKNEVSRLNDKISTLEAELLKMQVRKELLGRDSTGRAYWVVCGPGISPQVTVVNGSTAASELKDKEPEEPDMMNPSSWVSYESDGEIRALLEWLSDDDCREKEVRESIIQWQQSRSRGTNDSSASSSSSGGKALEASFLVTKAFTALEKKRKNEGRVYSCQCLEPLWPSRKHCLVCHQTYSSSEDLESHRDTCSPFSPSHENIEVNQDSSKGKRRMTETQVENCPEYDSGSSDPRCPFDFEEIKAKFVVGSSLKEMIKDVGLIRTNGTPSFVQSLPPYASDPALSLLKNETNQCNEPTFLDNQKTRANAATGVSTDNISHNSPKCVENSIDEEASRSRSASTSTKNKNAVLSSGKSRVLRESSLKPVTGRVSEILRLLKRNLLEMDAALSEDALRPSRVNSEKRFAWRAFIKSAASIYEMSQATVLLEDMIKTEYLKTDWWYWSTPSAASNIATLSALALRIYTLDAAIFYDKPPKRTPKRSHKVEKGRGNTSKSSTSWVSKDSDCDDGAGSSKFKNRSSKRRKTREVKTSN